MIAVFCLREKNNNIHNIILTVSIYRLWRFISDFQIALDFSIANYINAPIKLF